jgi:hypothetical protein
LINIQLNIQSYNHYTFAAIIIASFRTKLIFYPMNKIKSIVLALLSLAAIEGCVKERTANENYFLSHQVSTGDTTGALCINEFCARGSNYMVDELNPSSDHWVELYNRSNTAINLDSSNYYYSNDSTITNISGMTRLTHFTVPAKGWLVIFADDSDQVTSQHIHVPHISKHGGFIGLYNYNPNTQSLTKLTGIAYDSIAVSGSSNSVYPDGSGTWFTGTVATPDAANAHP